MEHADQRGRVMLYCWIGRGYQLNGKLDSSIANLNRGIQIAERVLSESPRDGTTLAYYALLNARRGKRPDIAIRAIQQALVFDSTSARVHYWKGRVHAIQNDHAKALSELAKAVAIEYSFSEILDPDFLSIARDADFTSTITRKTRNPETTQ